MTARTYFGTDGVRGNWGGPVVNEAFFARLGAAAGRWLAGRGESGREVLIGRDTRASGPALARALAAGLRSAGARPVELGVMPTPAVSRAVRCGGAALGAVITASHNPAADNGVKFFGPAGDKLLDADELAIEALLPGSVPVPDALQPPGAPPPADRPLSPNAPLPAVPASSPQAFSSADDPPFAGPASSATAAGAALEAYIAACAAILPSGALRHRRIALDTAHGATCATSPEVLRRLGAELLTLGDRPDGANINAGVGSEHPAALAALVRSSGAWFGLAQDGDGDRCVLCDERGDVLDGDEILTLLATDALARGTLAERTLVVTVQSNLGVDAAVAAAGGRVVRTPVGDRYVAERMRAEGATLGGESSGHILCFELGPSGDGLAAALRVAGVMARSGRPLSELRRALRRFPQASTALAVREKRPLESLIGLPAAIRELERSLGPQGRVLVRYSGTESKLRLLVEGPDEAAVEGGLAALAAAARAELEVE
jgi:phosphoglucosamine mutase